MIQSSSSSLSVRAGGGGSRRGSWRVREGSLESEASFADVFDLGDVITRGSYSSFRRCTHKMTGAQFAVKVIDLFKFTEVTGRAIKDMKREAFICHRLKHPHIVELLETYSSNGIDYMVFEFVEGTDICYEIVDRVGAGFVYSEAVASHYMRQLLDALQYCHNVHAIVHRDLRPEHILLVNQANSAPIKLSGFHNSALLDETWLLTDGEMVGAQEYMAPEMIERVPYGQAVDIWSCGVVMYLLLCGQLPFIGPSSDKLLYNITHGAFNMSGTQWSLISDEAKNLMCRMLDLDQNRRITASEALRHPWIADKHKLSRKHLQETVEELKHYLIKRELQDDVTLKNGKKDHGGGWRSSSGFRSRTADIPAHDYRRAISVTGPSTPAGPGSYCPHRRATSAATSPTSLPRSGYISPSSLAIKDSATEAVEDLLNMFECNEGLGMPSTISPSNPVFLNNFLNDSHLQSLLRLYDVMVDGSWSVPKLRPVSALQTANTVLLYLQQKEKPLKADTEELYRLLMQPHFSGLLKAYDWTSKDMETLKKKEEIENLTGSSAGRAVSSMGSGNGCGLEMMDRVDSSSTYSTIQRLRLVQFERNSAQPLGITLKIDIRGRCVVARIMHGGMIHKQGTLRVGDEIREINGALVSGKTSDTVQNMLRDLRGSVVLKVVPSGRNALSKSDTSSNIYVRAEFDYEPTQDELIPCPTAGIKFRIGDILEVTSKEDSQWWQARLIPREGVHQNGTSFSPSGLIPSPELIEWRATHATVQRVRRQTGNCSWFTRRRRSLRDKYVVKRHAVFDTLDLISYEEVVLLPAFIRKTLVLLGAHGVGRRYIKNSLIQLHPTKYAYPLPYTTLPQQPGEEGEASYHFVPYERMMLDIANSEYLEYGTHEGAVYGTRLDSIKALHSEGLMAVLDVEPQALKMIRTAEYAPYVVFIAAPIIDFSSKADSNLERLSADSKMLEKAYAHYFDLTIINNDIDVTIKALQDAIEKINQSPQWVPVSWAY